MNFVLIENLKDALAVIRKRIGRIEKRRSDYKESKTWVELKIKEQKLCGKIKRLKEQTRNELEQHKNGGIYV